MRTTRILLFLALLILLLGCRSQHKRSTTNIKNPRFIDLNTSESYSVKDIYKSISIIPLETNGFSIVNEVTKIIFHEGNYFILDQPQKMVFIFNKNGKYISKIDWIGEGPEEYGLLYDIIINRFTNNLELLDPQGRILICSLKGEFIGTINLPADIRAVHKFCYLTDDVILFFARYEESKLIYFSRSQGRIVKEHYEIPDFIIHKTPMTTLRSSPFNLFNDTIQLFESFTNNIYQIVNNDLVLKYSWDFGEYNFNINDLETDRQISYYINQIGNMKTANSFRYNIENNRFIYTSFLFRKHFNTLIFDKKDRTYKVINRFREDIFHPAFPTFFPEGVFAVINPMQLQLLVKEELLNEGDRKIFHNLKPDENPVIVKYYFR